LKLNRYRSLKSYHPRKQKTYEEADDDAYNKTHAYGTGESDVTRVFGSLPDIDALASQTLRAGGAIAVENNLAFSADHSVLEWDCKGQRHRGLPPQGKEMQPVCFDGKTHPS
jgi:hypothetical protein